MTHAESKIVLEVDLTEVVWEKLSKDLRNVVLGAVKLHVDSLRQLTPDVDTADIGIFDTKISGIGHITVCD